MCCARRVRASLWWCALACGACAADGGAASDAALRDGARADDAPGAALANCTERDFVDRSAVGADRSVYFGGAGDSVVFGYSPACVTVAAGQSVTFRGAFSGHPLRAGSEPSQRDAGTPGNPIPDTDTGDARVVAFPSAGLFPYYCELHWGGGMRGVVRVR